jgi:hypothetical protein
MKQIFILLAILFTGNLFSQNVGINGSGATPNTSAMLDIVSTGSGLLIPRMTNAQKNVITVGATQDGLIVYQTDAGTQGIGFYYYSNSAVAWLPFLSGWALKGNLGTTASTSALGAAVNNNFIGTTDAKDFVIATNNLERMRVLSAGNIGIGTVAPSTLFHIDGGTASTTQTIATLTANSLTTGTGLLISSTAITSGNLLDVRATNAVSNVANTSSAIYAQNDQPYGNAISAVSNNSRPNYSAIFAESYPTLAGSAFSISQSSHAIAANINNSRAYSFAIFGNVVNAPAPSGGVFGRYSATAWGSLGYNSIGAVACGVYGSSVYQSGTGYMYSGNIQTGVGGAFYGGVIGGWTRGEVMGHIATGELFASYNLGNEYTSGLQAEIVTLKDKRVAAYSVTSTEIKVYNDGTSKLTNGKARVNFETAFAELIGENKPVVTVAPMGECNGMYISNVSSKGFDITELNNGNSNVEFSYIVIGKRIDADNKPTLPEALSKTDFDEKMKGVMFNENNTEHSGTPIWWDGTKVRFDRAPEPAAGIKK